MHEDAELLRKDTGEKLRNSEFIVESERLKREGFESQIQLVA